MNVHLIIMAGGSGTRFWPKSTAKKPKQLLPFGSGKSLIKQTVERFDGVISNVWVVTTKLLMDSIQKELGPKVRVLAEPEARNTAPCVYWASRVIGEEDPDAILVFLPADHYIRNPNAFRVTVQEAIEWASENEDLVTLGVKPTRPETGYGYLHCGKPKSNHCIKVERFVEKPILENAKKFLSSGEYLWNGGMFIWKAEIILRAFDEAMPQMKKAWDDAQGNVEKAYPNMKATSIDFGVMEKVYNVVSFPLDCGWDDVGSWASLEDISEELNMSHDAGVVSQGECVSIDSTGNIVDSAGPVVSLLGVKDLIVVVKDGVVLVADKSRAQDIKQMVEAVKAKRPDLV
ncbi:MAG: mannose-1-phosphate guanylyltransferase [Xanthomonadaceae bacterium]|nr:mannose-1-phosphate guanylyltransferase [Xanthomonadaceae bacterium]